MVLKMRKRLHTLCSRFYYRERWFIAYPFSLSKKRGEKKLIKRVLVDFRPCRPTCGCRVII